MNIQRNASDDSVLDADTFFETSQDEGNEKHHYKAISMIDAKDLFRSPDDTDLPDDDGEDDGDDDDDDELEGWGPDEAICNLNKRRKRPAGKLPGTLVRRNMQRKRKAKRDRNRAHKTAKPIETRIRETSQKVRRDETGSSSVSRSSAQVRGTSRSHSKRFRGPISVKQFGENKNHVDALPINSLFRCTTVDEVQALHDKWAGRFEAKCRLAYKRRKLPVEMRSTIDALLDGRATTSPNLLNLKVLKTSWEHCFRLLWAVAEGNRDLQFALVTIIDGNGATSSYAPFIELANATRKAQGLARAISPDFLGVNEMALFKSQTHPDGGRHMQTHQHILCLGENVVARAKEVAKKRMFTFEPNVTSAPQIDIRPVEATKVNLARVCAYLFKQPHKSMNWVPARDGKPGFMNQSEKGERAINYLRVAQIRSMMNVDDIMFAGGACKVIKSDLIKLLRQYCLSEVPIIGRELHPDAVPSFWNEVNKALNRPELRLPIIGRNQ